MASAAGSSGIQAGAGTRARARVKGPERPCARARASGAVGGRLGRAHAKGPLTVLSVPHPVRVRSSDGEQAGGHELDRHAALRDGQTLRLLGGITIRWCPWHTGHADAVLAVVQVIVVRTEGGNCKKIKQRNDRARLGRGLDWVLQR